MWKGFKRSYRESELHTFKKITLSLIFTAWKVPKYGDFSGPHLDTFHGVIKYLLEVKWSIY